MLVSMSTIAMELPDFETYAGPTVAHVAQLMALQHTAALAGVNAARTDQRRP